MNAPLLSTVRSVVEETNALAADGVLRSTAKPINSALNRNLYKAREQIYPKLVHGRFRLLKWVGMAVMLAIYYGLPWVRWERGAGAPDQAVLVDLVRQRFYFFWIEIWPQEVYYITGLLILAALGLFLVTALFGRVWCGYACPQTVWTDLYIMVERLIEGDRNARIRLDKSPWSFEKIRKRVAKHAIWLLIAAGTGGAWIFYFHDAPTLAATLFQGTADMTAYLFLGILTFTTYWLAGHMREQVCTFMCPWPRIQAALIDQDTLQVTYRTDRGEKRGPHKKGQPWEGRGHCIDCNQCVAACPMGIDIRDGDQLECINCALCIDACDEVMAKVGYPKGLIRYSTQNAIDGTPTRVLRPRILVYGMILLALMVGWAVGVTHRSPLIAEVLRDRNALYRETASGIENSYTLKLVNKTDRPQQYRVELRSDLAGLRLRDASIIPVAAGSVASLPLTLSAPAGTGGRHGVTFVVHSADGQVERTVDSSFFGPM